MNNFSNKYNLTIQQENIWLIEQIKECYNAFEKNMEIEKNKCRECKKFSTLI